MDISIYEQVVESQHAIIFRVSTDGILTFSNKAACLFCNREKGELVGTRALEHVPEDLRLPVEEILHAIRDNPHTPPSRLQEKRIKEGRDMWVQWSIYPVFCPQERCYEVQFEGTDITEQKQIEDALSSGKKFMEATNNAVQSLLKAKHWEDEISHVLGHLGTAADAGRVYIFIFHQDEKGTKLSSQRYEWVAPGVESNLDAPYLQNIPYEDTPYKEWVERIGEGDIIRGHVKDLTDEERFFFTDDIKSYVFMPIFVDRALWGWMGFDICDQERELDDDATEAFNTVADALSTAIEHASLENKLEHSHTFLKKIINHMVEPLFVKDQQHRWILVNDSYCALTGLSREMLIGKSDYDFYKKEEAEVFWGKDRLVLETGVENVNDEDFTDSNGTFHIIRTKKAVYTDVAGDRFIVGVISDITEQKRLEELMRESESNFRLLAEEASDVIARHDKNGRFIYVSPSAVKHFGYDPKELIGALPHEFVHPRDVSLFHDGMAKIQTGEEVITIQYRAKPRGRPWGWFETSTRGVTDKSTRKVIELISVTRDISERKRVEEEMRKALGREKELGELRSRFLSMTSHEFGTPLCTLTISAELILKHWDKFNDDKKLHYIRQMLDCATHMSKLIDDILLIGRSDAGMLDFNPENLSIEAYCQSLIEEAVTSAGNRSLIIFKNDSTSDTIRTDEKMLRHILLNLLMNALKYSPDGGDVLFAVRDTKKAFVFSVEDKGIGIPADEQNHIFEPFHRGRNASPIKGSGLGLAITKKAVENLKGTISFKTRVGAGTTFTVTLPHL